MTFVNQSLATQSGSSALTNNTVTAIVNVTNASGSVAGGHVHYAVQVTNGTDYQYEVGIVSFGVTNKAATIANNVCTKFGNQQAATSGSLTVTWTITAASPAVLSVNANSSLTPSTGYPLVTWWIDNLTSQVMTGS